MNEENVEVNAVDALASEYGWKPEGKKSAADYIKFALEKLPERGEALSAQSKTIEAKESELSMMKATLEELSGHMKKQKEVAYNEAMAAFKEQKRQAILNGDVDAVDALEASIAPQQEEKHEVHPCYFSV
jgi:predicted  nucleic acid-binding Zn-ribbon protein